MRETSVIPIPPAGERRTRLVRATQARRRLDSARRGRLLGSERSATGGRAWVNGREVGGGQGRYAHLGRVHD